MSNICNEIKKWRHYLKAFFWLMLMVGFTYTAVISSVFKIEDSIGITYCMSQGSVVGLIVNIGLIAMVFFEYLVEERQIMNKYFLAMLFNIFVAILVFYLAGQMREGGLGKLVFPFSWDGTVYILHGIFLTVLLVLKEKTYENGLGTVQDYNNPQLNR